MHSQMLARALDTHLRPVCGATCHLSPYISLPSLSRAVHSQEVNDVQQRSGHEGWCLAHLSAMSEEQISSWKEVACTLYACRLSPFLTQPFQYKAVSSTSEEGRLLQEGRALYSWHPCDMAWGMMPWIPDSYVRWVHLLMQPWDKPPVCCRTYHQPCKHIRERKAIIPLLHPMWKWMMGTTESTDRKGTNHWHKFLIWPSCQSFFAKFGPYFQITFMIWKIWPAPGEKFDQRQVQFRATLYSAQSPCRRCKSTETRRQVVRLGGEWISTLIQAEKDRRASRCRSK